MVSEVGAVNNHIYILRTNFLNEIFYTSHTYHSFDFLPPLTPVTTSSPNKKSGYLNPPILAVCVRHAAPSTGCHLSAHSYTAKGRILTNKHMPRHEIPSIREQINSSIRNLLHRAPPPQRDILHAISQVIRRG